MYEEILHTQPAYTFVDDLCFKKRAKWSPGALVGRLTLPRSQGSTQLATGPIRMGQRVYWQAN